MVSFDPCLRHFVVLVSTWLVPLTYFMAEYQLQSLEIRDLSRSSLPVIVTAKATLSASDSEVIAQPTDTPISSVVTATHVVLTTTTIFTTIVSKAKETTFSPTNALQVLSAAERSFSLKDIQSDLPQVITDALIRASGATKSFHPSLAPTFSASGSLLSSQINENPGNNNLSYLPSIITNSTTIKLNPATSAIISSSSIVSISHQETSLLQSSLASSARTSEIGRQMARSTLTFQNRVVSSLSAARTDEAPQPTASVSSSSSISIQRVSRLQTAGAAIAALSLIFR